MGIRHCMHLGPYVECTYKQAMTKVIRRGCTNTACTQHPTSARNMDLTSAIESFTKAARLGGTAKFCSTCAGPIGDVAVSVRDRPNYYDVVGDELTSIQSDEDHAGDIVYLAANVRRAGDPGRDLDSDETIHLDLDDSDPVAEVEWFEKAFAKELAALRKVYETVEVRWGFHHYYR